MRNDRPHQARVLAWALPRSSAAFFLDMRLGKTHIAIRWAEHKTSGIKLVVAPVTTLISWCEELEADGMEYVMLHGASKSKLKQLDGRKKSQKWILVNPEGLRACPDILAGLPVSCVILDESTFIANPRAKITRLVQTHLSRVQYKAILTGDPDPEGMLHAYYEQMKFVAGPVWMNCQSFWPWRLRYFHQSRYDWIPHSQTEFLIQREVKKDAFVMSSEKIFNHKPVYIKRHIEMPEKLKKAYKKAWKEMELGNAQTKWTPVVQNWLAQIAGGSLPKDYKASGELVFCDFKIKELQSLLNTELANKQVVVYFRFTRELLKAARSLQECTVVRGATPLDIRKERIREFRDGKVRILLIQAKCAMYALPLWCASAAIFYSNYWENKVRNQCEARLHGERRKGDPLYVDLVTTGTVEEAVVTALREKSYNSSQFLKRVRELSV